MKLDLRYLVHFLATTQCLCHTTLIMLIKHFDSSFKIINTNTNIRWRTFGATQNETKSLSYMPKDFKGSRVGRKKKVSSKIPAQIYISQLGCQNFKSLLKSLQFFYTGRYGCQDLFLAALLRAAQPGFEDFCLFRFQKFIKFCPLGLFITLYFSISSSLNEQITFFFI